MSDVVVLGAGPAGLMAALQVARSGRSCTLFEAADHVGGMAGSFEVAGQRVDFGSHRLHPATPPATLALLHDLLGDDLQTRPRAGRLFLGGRWVGFPLRATELARSLPPLLTARLVFDSAVTSLRGLLPTNPCDSFDEEVRARLGPTVAREFYGPYAEKLYGLTPDLLDAELARRRVSASSPAAIARRLVSASRPTGRTFLYPRRGYGQIAEALADAAVSAGVEIRLSSRVKTLEVSDNQVTVSSADGHRVETGTALSTLPATTLGAIVQPRPPTNVTAALDRVRTRGMVLVYLVLDQDQYTPYDAHYLPGLDTTVARISEPKNYRDGDDPPGQTVLCAEIACWPGDDIWGSSDEDLAELVAGDLSRLGLPPINPITTETHRLPSVYPVYDRAGFAARQIVDGWTRTDGRLVMLGRQGLRVIDNLHHVLSMGEAAAASLDENGRLSTARWHAHLDLFGTHTVED